MDHEYDMGRASLINISVLIKRFFWKHYELFPDNQKFLTIFYITIQNTCQLCDNWRNIYGEGHQRLKLVVVETITVRCQNMSINFDGMVTVFENPFLLRSKMTYIPLVSDTSL